MKNSKLKIAITAICLVALLCSFALAGCAKHEHTYESAWTWDDTHHWKKATCEHSTEKGEYGEHSLTGGVCACGYSAITYTVTEEEWKMNFNLTKTQVEAQTLSCLTWGEIKAKSVATKTASSGITSYTVYAEGTNSGTSGTSLLKVAPNAMSIEFYVEGQLKESESGTYTNSETLYKTLTSNILAYFPFANNYGDFTFDQERNVYVAQNMTSIMVDDYDPSITRPTYTKTAEVTFVNGYLNTVKVQLCDSTFTDVFANFDFTFSNMNNTTVEG